MFHISVTLIDSDIPFSLPAKWGKDHQVIEIQTGTYLNGNKALILTLVPLTNPEINDFPKGIFPVGRKSCNYACFEYFPCIYHPYPLSIGSAYGTLYHVSEVKKVNRKDWRLYQGCWKFEIVEQWRLTLTYRRDPILLLPNRDE